MNNTSLCLSKSELSELSGFQYPGHQIKWLRSQGFTFRIAADGHPKVDRSHYAKMMGGSSINTHISNSTVPNFSTMGGFKDEVQF